jgi:hypothetical protein
MKFSMTGQDKSDLLIRMTAWTDLTVINGTKDHESSMSTNK